MKTALTAINAELDAIREAGTWREERIITTPQYSRIDTTAKPGVVKKLAEGYFHGLLQEAIGENEECGIRKKPAPDSLLAVMERLGADTHSTVYVGDSEVDIQTAQNAGVDCISVTWGFKDKDFLVDNGATVLVDSVEELLEKIS